jgi:hypothetical protein
MPEEVRNSPTCRGKKKNREHGLESLEEYEVAERTSETDLDAAETILAHLFVEYWLGAKPELSTEVRPGALTQDEAVFEKDEDAA